MSTTAYRRVVTFSLLCVLLLIVFELRHNTGSATSYSPPGKFRAPATMPADYLSVHVGDIDFENLPLGAVLGDLARRSGANLGVDGTAIYWDFTRGVEVVAYNSTRPATLKMSNPTLGAALIAIGNTVALPDEQGAGVGQDPAGILLLSLSTRDGRERSVTTIPRFYAVDDLIGPFPTYVRPIPTSYPVDDYLIPRQARPELKQLAIALRPFAGHGEVGCFGRRLMVNGYSDAHENIAATLDRLRHPIHLTQAATRPVPAPELPKVPIFLCPAGTSARDAWGMWEKLGAGHVVAEFNMMEEPFLSKVVDFEMHDSSLEEIANGLIVRYGWPLILVPAGDQDDRLHVRQFRWENAPRAYDVSAILAHAEPWIEDAKMYAPDDPVPSNEELLIRLIAVHVPHDDAAFVGSGNDPALASCWNGTLLLREDPQIHVRVLRFLEHLQRTGRPIDPPPDQ